MYVSMYSTRVIGPAHVQNVTDLACRTALSRRGVSHIKFPVDLQEMEADREDASKRNVPHPTAQVWASCVA